MRVSTYAMMVDIGCTARSTELPEGNVESVLGMGSGVEDKLGGKVYQGERVNLMLCCRSSTV